MKIDKDSRLLNIYVPVLLFMIGFFWKLYFINYRDISIDEPYSIFNAQKSVADILKIPAEGEPNPPLFMLLLHFWIKLFGLESYSVRVLPLIFNAVTVLFIYFTGKRFFSFWTGFMASGLFIFSTYHFFHGLEARTYSLLSMATASSLYFYMNYVQDVKNIKALAGLILSNLFLVYSHYFGWYVIFSQFLTGFFYVRSFKMFFRFQIPSIATLVGFLPMVPIVLKQFEKSSKGTWLHPPNPDDYTLQFYYLVNHKQVLTVFLYVIGAGLIFTIVMLIKKKWKGFNIGVAVLLVWWLVPYTIMYLISPRLPMFISRYILFNTIGLFLFSGALISFLYQKNKYLEPLAGLVVAAFMFIHLRILPDDFGRREVKDSVEFVKKYDTERDNRVIIIYPVWADLPFSYYYDKAIFNDCDHFYSTCQKNHIYRVWKLSDAKEIMNALENKRIIMYMERLDCDSAKALFEYLDSTYIRIDMGYFPQIYSVGIYDPKPEKLE